MADDKGDISEIAMDPEDEAHLTAAVDMIGRTGATQVQIRYSDDEVPVVWFLVAAYKSAETRTKNRRSGNPAQRGAPDAPELVYESASASNPIEASYRLLERLLDGGVCQHCGRPSGVNRDWQDEMPASQLICWYTYDPEIRKFRRACEGDT